MEDFKAILTNSKRFTKIEVNKYAKELYEMCQDIAETEERELDAVIAVEGCEKLNQILSCEKEIREAVYKEMQDGITSWDSIVFEQYRAKEVEEQDEMIWKPDVVAMSGEFKCKRCGCQKAIFEQKQTRSADEQQDCIAHCQGCGLRVKIA